jgi:hypothetical protein
MSHEHPFHPRLDPRYRHVRSNKNVSTGQTQLLLLLHVTFHKFTHLSKHMTHSIFLCSFILNRCCRKFQSRNRCSVR